MNSIRQYLVFSRKRGKQNKTLAGVSRKKEGYERSGDP